MEIFLKIDKLFRWFTQNFAFFCLEIHSYSIVNTGKNVYDVLDYTKRFKNLKIWNNVLTFC